MVKTVSVIVTLLFATSFAIPCATAAEIQYAQQQAVHASSQPLQLNKNRDVQAVKPKKPVSIKLRRAANGQYSWDITGHSADDVYRADSRLRKLLKPEQ
jgi:hypothetical protein